MSTAERPDAATTPRDAPIGGQAVLEGVMMRGVSTWAVTVRKPDLAQGVDARHLAPGEEVRGVVALVESLGIGYRALAISANAQLGEDEKEISGGAWWGTVALSLAFAIGLFFLIPAGVTSLFGDAL